MHAFMVGVHTTSRIALVAVVTAALSWVGFNMYFLIRDPTPSVWRILALSYGAVVLFATINYGLSQRLGYNPITRQHETSAEPGHE